MPQPVRRSFEELERILGTDWVKDETEAPMGAFVNYNRHWPCGCRWAQGNGVMVRCLMEWLWPCPEHADLGFHATFDDERWRPQSELSDRTARRKGVVVTPEMLPDLVPGQVLRVREWACAEAHGQTTVRDRLIGAWLYIVRPPDPRIGEGVVIEQRSFGPMSSVGILGPESLANNEVRLVSRGEERWPDEPVWVRRKLEYIPPREVTSPA